MKPCPLGCTESCCAWVGGIGGLTPEEEQPWIDLLNGGQRCECGQCSDECSSPLPMPGIRNG